MAFTGKQAFSPEAKLWFSHALGSDEILDMIMNAMAFDDSIHDFDRDEALIITQNTKYDSKEVKHWCRHAMKDIEAGDDLFRIIDGGCRLVKMVADDSIYFTTADEIKEEVIKPFSERSRLYLIHACGQVEIADEILEVLHKFAEFAGHLDGSGVDVDNNVVDKVEDLTDYRSGDDEEIPEYPEAP